MHELDKTGLEAALRSAYEKVAAWPENRMTPNAVEELGEGFTDLLKLRNLVPDVLAYLSTTSAGVTEEQVEAAAKAYATATGYYVEFHRGLKSNSSELIRKGIRAALEASRVAPVSQKEAATYAENLARALWEKHYKDAVPQWEPLSGDVVGLLTQIDNMTAGLAPAPAGEPAPVGWKLVPLEPMPEMLGAWYRYKNGHHFHDEPPPQDTSDYGAYRAMLAAAPSPSPAPPVGVKVALDEIAEEARRYAGFYPEASDGRNTFIIFAEWIERRSALHTTPTPVSAPVGVVEALKAAQERFAQIDCALIGQTQNTTPQELLDWCKCIASHGFDATSKALRSPAVEGK